MEIGRRVALISVLVSALLAVGKIVVGWLAGSTSVVADGLESAGDAIASGFVALGFTIAARPADENHPYGHGRYETLTGFLVGIILFVGGIGICYRSLQQVGAVTAVRHAVVGLLSEINTDVRSTNPRVMTLAQLCDHFEQRELSKENTWRSHATKKIYKAYLTRWVRRHWYKYELAEVRTIQVESSLRGLPLAISGVARHSGRITGMIDGHVSLLATFELV